MLYRLNGVSEYDITRLEAALNILGDSIDVNVVFGDYRNIPEWETYRQTLLSLFQANRWDTRLLIAFTGYTLDGENAPSLNRNIFVEFGGFEIARIIVEHHYGVGLVLSTNFSNPRLVSDPFTPAVAAIEQLQNYQKFINEVMGEDAEATHKTAFGLLYDITYHNVPGENYNSHRTSTEEERIEICKWLATSAYNDFWKVRFALTNLTLEEIQHYENVPYEWFSQIESNLLTPIKN